MFSINRLRIMRLVAGVCLASTLVTHLLAAEEPPCAARSIHLFYDVPAATVFYNQLTVNQSQPGSYFMACGFQHGYFGIQELAGGHKVALFSVWDPPGKDDPKATPPDERAAVLYQADDVRIRRFGGEGTGCSVCSISTGNVASSIVSQSWPGHWERRRRLTPPGYSCPPLANGNIWRRSRLSMVHRAAASVVATRSSKTSAAISKATGRSRKLSSAAAGFALLKGDGCPLQRRDFTASDSPTEAKNSIDAGTVDRRFFLATGGDTQTHTPLGALLERTAGDESRPEVPADEKN